MGRLNWNKERFMVEVNRKRFSILSELISEAKEGDIKSMPLPHYIFKVEIRRVDIQDTEPIIIYYHGNFGEWARGKPIFPKVRALQVFADFVIDAGLSITKTTKQFIEASELDSDLASVTWLEFTQRRKELQQKLNLTAEEIIQLANIFYSLEVNSRLQEVIIQDKTEAV